MHLILSRLITLWALRARRKRKHTAQNKSRNTFDRFHELLDTTYFRRSQKDIAVEVVNTAKIIACYDFGAARNAKLNFENSLS